MTSAELDAQWRAHIARSGSGSRPIAKRSDVADAIERQAQPIAKAEGISLPEAVDLLLTRRPELYTEYLEAAEDSRSVPVGKGSGDTEPDAISKRALQVHPDLSEAEAVTAYLATEVGAEHYRRLYA